MPSGLIPWEKGQGCGRPTFNAMLPKAFATLGAASAELSP
jgi:hypothetical protein